MFNSKRKIKKHAIKLLAFVWVLCFSFGACSNVPTANITPSVPVSSSNVEQSDLSIDLQTESFFDEDVVYKLPDEVSSEEYISVIVDMEEDGVMDTYSSSSGLTLTEYVNSNEAKKLASKLYRKQSALINKLNRASVGFVVGERYDTLLCGFEITIKAKDFEKVCSTLENDATVILGDTYEKAATEVVHNYVDVYETGIFDTSNCEYQGDGVVVAVLDTGLDYTHTAFSVDNFTTSEEAFTLENVSAKVDKTMAAQFTPGLTGADVYVNRKVPFAYDYADKDPDVLPISSEHGTHVAGVIAGKDDTITGVAPNAQLAIMKVFSDTSTGAKTSWLLSALEDCVTLGVDVINMSLGSSCGFTREVDKESTNVIYDKIRDAGISLITAAANDYNATFGSEKNGSNGLTSNPDSGTVGSPSTYEGALSVASVDGVKTPYVLYGDQIIYFNEASTSSAKTKDFVDDILKTVGGVDSYEFQYVTIPGVGRSSDYPEDDSFYAGKIVLVKRGITTFEDKVRIALKEKGASGIIIYNNVSGTISMSVGADVGAVCSISQDEGEMLAAAGTGTIKISKSQVAGPFMSNFSSWGPTSDLKIKPEITAHGGEILSAVPGQDYDRLSGTSMAAPNMAGAAALIRQYVKFSGVFGDNLSTIQITDLVNQLMMSTADIVMNKNGLPFAVRKQGAGLVNISNAISSAAYLTTYDKDGERMNKAKLELGDDPEKTGVYTMKFDIHNVSSSQVTYDIDSIIMTEGVSTTYTSHGDTTVTMEGYLLSGTTTKVTAFSGDGSSNGNKVSVGANGVATVTVEVKLSDEDKKYIEDSFKHGMYVEGFIKLTASQGTEVDMSVPMLAFYGDWTEAPIFDEEYYDTHKDEVNAGLDPEDKLMPDAYATRVIGGLYSDYIATLGTYYFIQDPSAAQIAADKQRIALSNQTGQSGAINSIRSIYCGLLRNVKEATITIVEDSTGETIFSLTEHNLLKSHSSGNTIYPSSMDVEFNALEHQLKNNTQYTVTVSSYIDYGAKDEQNNVRNTFEFPLYIDFEAPVITDVEYRTEYDKQTKKTKLFADLNVYDNHYAMSLQLGQIVPADPSTGYAFTMKSFGKYMTPVYSSFNSTSKVTIELTDYVAQIKESAGIDYTNGSGAIVNNNNSFIATCYDYAMNSAVYEIRLPDEIISMYFSEDLIELSPNETKELSSILSIFPSESWMQTLNYTSSDTTVVDIVNQTLIAKQSGTATITATGRDENGNEISASTEVKVLSPEDEGYVGGYTIPEVNKFAITGYYVNKAYYHISSDEREIGLTDGTYDFSGALSLSMFPSESVTLNYVLDSYFPDRTSVIFRSANERIATVTEDGTVVAQAEGTTLITISVMFDGQSSLYSGRVAINVKDPFTTNSIYLMNYRGLGGTVEIPADRGVTMIYDYAFSNYEYVEKDLENGDVINEEDPYYLKQMYIGEDTITKVIIPEGVTHINSYAFAKLTALEEVVLPSTLTTIGLGAFYGCEKLKTINLEHVKFINERAFSGCALEEIELDSVVAIGNYTFENCKLNYIVLPKSSQSLGIGAFYKNEYLTSVQFDASKIKIGANAFEGCTQLSEIDINAAVISSRAFYGCAELEFVTLGKDVSFIGEFAFGGTKVASFQVSDKNTAITASNDGAMLYKGTELLLVAPMYSGVNNTITTDAESIATGAFAGNTKLFNVVANNVKYVAPYAFAECTNLRTVTMNNVENIDSYAFYFTALKATPSLEKVTNIGEAAFLGTQIKQVEIADGAIVGDMAFALNLELESVVLGDDVVIGDRAFYMLINDYSYEQTQSIQYYTPYLYEVKDGNGQVVESSTYYRYDFTVGVLSKLTQLVVGDNASIGDYAFYGNAKLSEAVLGSGAKIGSAAFFNCGSLTNIDLSQVLEIGDNAFSGTRKLDFSVKDNFLNYAYEKEYRDGEIVAIDIIYSSIAPVLNDVDISSVTTLGKGAFQGSIHLNSVVFGEAITSIPEHLFNYCTSLESVVLPAQVNAIGDYAFYATAFDTIDLSNVDEIGNSAFAYSALASAKLKDGVVIGDDAFAQCFNLSSVENIDNVSYFGDYSFAFTDIESVNFATANYIGDFAFAGSSLKNVTFGDKLVGLGENPFALCEITSFAKTVDMEFGGSIVGQEGEETYDISETVKVINGVLYKVVPNGLVLVSYPMMSDNSFFVVEEGTVRISAQAFVNCALESVTLPSTLKSLGDKAFYGCESLSVVVFRGYNAPLLEEAYNESYAEEGNYSFTGIVGEYEGLGIAPYYMWNFSSNNASIYFGASFVNYIGHIANKIVMVKPANGLNYNSFIFSQYFGCVVEGSNAAIQSTLDVIAQINLLPSNISLSDEELVVAIRNAYNSLPSVEQQALVANYSKLVDAEATIVYLKNRDTSSSSDVVEEPTKSSFGEFLKNNLVGLIIALVAVLALVGYILVDKLVLKKQKTKE